MKLRTLLVFTSACIVGAAFAQTDQLRPGLWEHSMSVKGGGQAAAAMAQAQQQMANLPADQRKMIEKWLAADCGALTPKAKR